MTKSIKIATANCIFFAVAILHFYGLFSSERLAFITKPLIISTLVIVYLVSVKKANFWYVSALFFSFWGDVLLLFKNQFFILGLFSFLVAHLLYIKIILKSVKKISILKMVIVSIPFLFYLIGFLFLILDNVIDIKLPVIVYGMVISIFGILSFLQYLQQKSTISLWLFLGALFFMLSDSLIAVDKFYEPSENGQFYIMITYVLAQYLICKHFIAKTYDL